ncbi:LacI family DNA-binding transcriptional regulator [Chelativorans alearense]|uniref:LacI family DNA-binding transcriptional regulator n=1 Tax=Chelativorans alearense TaxID=2681495 RepID=UPI0013D063C9|nr:LacI family DNA-binding transcriptional regulator [Chelativorans alearense]
MQKTSIKKRVTLKDVANAVGVHVSTVSRALDPRTRHLITPEVAEQILKASERLDYRQNAAAYSLKTNRTRTIGVVVPDITNPVFPPIIRGVEDALASRGYVAILGNTDGDMRRETGLVETFRSRGVDGLILASVEREDAAVSKLAAEGLPVITVNRRVDDSTVASVVNDEAEGIRRVLTHLVSLGHRRVANIAGPQSLSTGAARYAGFEKYRGPMGLADDRGLVVFANAFNEAEGERCVEELLASGAEFTAIVCSNDRLAVGAIAALSRHGRRCPEDVSVTGYNDMPMVERMQPPLTTIRIQSNKVGFEAGQLLVQMIERPPGEYVAEHIVLPIELIVRGSTRAIHAPNGQDGDTAKPRVRPL